MFETSTHINDLDAIECRNFERNAGLSALIWVKATLSMVIVSTADHFRVASQEKRVGTTAANLHNFFL